MKEERWFQLARGVAMQVDLHASR